MTELFENSFMKKKGDFLKSPVEAPTHRKVLLEDEDISQRHKKHSKDCVKGMTKSYPKTVVTLAKPC